MKNCDGAAKRGRTKCKSYKAGGSVQARIDKAVEDATDFKQRGGEMHRKIRKKEIAEESAASAKPKAKAKSKPKSRMDAVTNRKKYIDEASGYTKGGMKRGGKVRKKCCN